MPVSYFKENLILLRNSDNLYKISKITPHSDGGFNILMPYCREKKGYVFKFNYDYSKRESQIPIDSMIQEYTIDKDTKLSIHKSGFVQFSGSGVLSGIDPSTGKIRGMGIFSNPLVLPIKSGPTFGFTLWGLSSYDVAEGIRKSVNKIIFDESDLYYRFLTLPSDTLEEIDWDGYLIEGYYFGNFMLPAIRYVEGKPQITVRFHNFEIPNAIFTFKVIFIENSPGFIGLIASKLPVSYSGTRTGYVLSGPTGSLMGNVATAILCAYPIPPFVKTPLQSLSYEITKV